MSTAPGRPTLYIERSQSREEEESPVRAFYRHKSILVTNPHEFSCKLLILKLLQTCDVTYIFVLLRPKKTKSLSEMYEEYIGSELFSYVGNTKLLEKVVPVAAFQTLPALGLDSRDLRLLLANVSIVFHSTDT
ncbi:putative fatty acyl-CoA reductase [Halotydeus destructor]|nr:putative fatty acyl-CoA reductase [Halotydeus destructor]